MESLGTTIKGLREGMDLPLRKVAAYLDIDQAVLSKIENGLRMPKREQVVQLAKYFKIDKDLLLIKWLAGKLMLELKDDELALEALQLAEAQIRHKKVRFKKGLSEKFNYFKLGEAAGMEKLLRGDNLPSYVEFARYLYNTATGDKFDENIINPHTGFIGENDTHEAYLFYKPDLEWLKQNALTLNMIKELPPYQEKRRLIFASRKYVDDETCKLHHIDFCQLPYEIYQIKIMPARNN